MKTPEHRYLTTVPLEAGEKYVIIAPSDIPLDKNFLKSVQEMAEVSQSRIFVLDGCDIQCSKSGGPFDWFDAGYEAGLHAGLLEAHQEKKSGGT